MRRWRACAPRASACADHRPARRLVRPHRAHVAGRRGRRRERRVLHALRREARASSSSASWSTTRRARRAASRGLHAIGAKILAAVPGAALASDQHYRESDLAIDFCEDVAPLPRAAVDRIVAMMEAEGMTAKVSSIHVNGWFGTLRQARDDAARCSPKRSASDLDAERERYVFVGDSPNDAPMFAYFPERGRRGQHRALPRPHRDTAGVRHDARGGRGVRGARRLSARLTSCKDGRPPLAGRARYPSG